LRLLRHHPSDQGYIAKSTGLPKSVEGHPLRQAINDVVVQWLTTKLQKGEPVDVAFMAREITAQPNRHGTKSIKDQLAHIVGSVADKYLKRRELIQADDATTSGGNGSSFCQDFRILTSPPYFKKRG
jgi:hypothetical protein